MTSPIPTRRPAHFVGIFIIAFAVLAYQVLLTRLFSVMLYYHFAFAGVSLVMLGLTIGAERVYLNKSRFSAEQLDSELGKAALRFAVTSILAVFWFLYIPLLVPNNVGFLLVVLSMMLFVVPLVFSGICVTLILTRSKHSVGRLYAADLVGAATGCVGIVALLFFVDPISIFLALAALVGLSACIMAPPKTPLSRTAGILTGVLCALCLVQTALYVSGRDHFRVVWAKGSRQDHIIFERWNALSRVRVIPYANAIIGGNGGPYGWGFGHPQRKPIGQLWLDIDADAATVITHFDGVHLAPLSYLGNDVINVAYHLRPMKTVAVVGVGGGRDVMSALYFGVKHVTGIELNPAIFEILTRRFADFTGNFYKRPDVSLVNAEARSWINQSHENFDLIQISLIDTWAATAAGGLTMSENKLYTVDAWKELLARLHPAGVLEVSRWFDPNAHRNEFYRLLSLATETLKERGVPDRDLRSHILAFQVNRIVTVLVSTSPFTATEIAQAHRTAAAQGFKIIIDPATSFDQISGIIISGRADPTFYDTLPVDITAPTDNRPFFFYTWKPFASLAAHMQVDKGANSFNNVAVEIVGFLLIATFLSVCLFVIRPLSRSAYQAPLKPMVPNLCYFAGIGLGFMLIEISQMQRLMVFLGDPVFGLTVLLFSLLLSGGLGSFTVKPGDTSATLWYRSALCFIVLCMVGLLTPKITTMLSGVGIPERIAASVALLAPAGFCMGMMFPTGMILSREFAEQQAWFWGVNGAASVFASVLGMALSMEYGIAEAYWTGVACYFLCVLLALPRSFWARTSSKEGAGSWLGNRIYREPSSSPTSNA
ncbi:MAG TPA: hypothetical protein VGK90_09115 [Rhizomicrobium sp.]